MIKQEVVKEKNEEVIERSKSKMILVDKRRSISMFVILLISFLIVLLWVNRSNVCPENIVIWTSDRIASIGRGKGFPVEISGSKVMPGNFTVMDGTILEVSDTDFVCLNNTGREISKQKHRFSNPMLKTNGCRIMIYDAGNKGYSLYTRTKEMYRSNSKQNILCGGISKNGIYGIITESDDYLSEMSIFGRNNEEIYKYYFANCYISYISMSDNGKNAVVSGITANDGDMKSIVYIFEFDKESPCMVYEYDNNMIFKVEYFSNGNIVAVGDKSISFINPWINDKNDIYYDDKILNNFDIEKDLGVAYSFSYSSEGEGSQIIVLDRGGNKCADISVEDSIRGISYKEDSIAILSKNKAICYNLSGNIEGQREMDNFIKGLVLNSPSIGYTIGVCDINKIQLK